MDNALNLLGLAWKAGRLEAGEEPVGASARARKAKLLLLASDAADNTVRRAAHFGQAGKVLFLTTPYTKAELGRAVSRSSCAMLALTDAGLAGAFAQKLADRDPARYGAAAAQTGERAAKALARQKEQRRHEKKLERAGRRPWSPPPEQSAPKAPPGAKKRAGPKERTARPPKPRAARPNS